MPRYWLNLYLFSRRDAEIFINKFTYFLFKMITIFYYDRKLKSLEFSEKNLLKVINKPIWLDIEKGTKEHFKIIKKVFDLHPLTIEDLMTKPTHIKIEEFKDYLLIVTKAIDSEEKHKLSEMDFVIGKKFLITNHDTKRDSINRLIEDQERLEQLMRKGVDFVMHRIIDVEIDNYIPVIQQFDDQIEKLEQEAIKNPDQTILKRILLLKRKITDIKKSTFPQREVIGLLARREYKYISPGVEAYFRDVYDHALHISRTLENQVDSVGSTFDAYMSSLSNNMNSVMKVLSIIATIMLPLTFITGVYGMNFRFLPASKHPFGFWGTIIFMGLLAIFMLIVFWRKKWI